MRIVKEDDLLAEICKQMGWEQVTEENVGKIDRVEVKEDGVEVVQRKFTVRSPENLDKRRVLRYNVTG